MTTKRTAAALVLIGWALVVIGIGVVSLPLALIAAGCGLFLLGALAIQVEP